MEHETGHPGGHRDLDAQEALLWSFWPRKEREREPALMSSKWFDYRTYHPVSATYLFSQLLAEQVRSIIRDHINDAPARIAGNGTVLDWHPVKAGDVFEPPSMASRRAYWERKARGLIRARQAADTEGIPYPLFIRTALDHFYRGAGGYVMAARNALMPEPNLLYGEAVMAAIRARWVEEIQIRVQAATHPRYRLENDDGHPDLAEHRRFLLDQLKLRADPSLAGARLVREGLLSEADLKLALITR